MPPSQYLVNGDVLAAYDDEHNTKLEAYTVGMHDGNTYTTPVPTSHTYTAEQAACVYDVETKVFWVAPAPKDKDGVVYEDLSPRDKQKFDASRFKEIDNLLKLGALSVMNLKESSRHRQYLPEFIIPSNMLDKWKLQDDGSLLAKSRNVLIG